VSTILTIDIWIINGAADLVVDLVVDLAVEALAKVAAAFIVDIEIEMMAIAYTVEAIPTEFILGIVNIAAVIIYINSLRSTISVIRKATSL
jgi:hypothetical protein